jgi:hypothetical protein
MESVTSASVSQHQSQVYQLIHDALVKRVAYLAIEINYLLIHGLGALPTPHELSSTLHSNSSMSPPCLRSLGCRVMHRHLLFTSPTSTWRHA